ncbi:RNA polymerase sigma factor [Paraburkholderia rhizosphaerae]|uniref:RNA polymerase sigma-70 factor (ECF subfamily) n=1 Tax=Paraburkholderia rhizosphaerae TaxID=480658 RepID=A0A4R8LXU0_9BURK|nr:sigma factor-like helix-turn-helix DNA-binding protein [Paraburkholderia rhizosphaerae]TDY51496.1 RNA polymerase sigma-70 factor (ECF subfamily) [Paraburkholderia rhizosphaerae]
MNAVSNPAVLRALVSRVWSFAYRVTEDVPLAEAMVANACNASADAGHPVSERETLVRMLAAAHSVLRSGSAYERYERSRRAGRDTSGGAARRRARNADVHSRILSEFRSLAPPERAALLLAEVEGLTYEETAEVLGVSVDRARLAHVAVRLKLGRAFNDHGSKPPMSASR